MNSTSIQNLAAAFVLSAVVTAAPLAVHAQAQASDDDKKFVETALKGGMAEIELGKLALEKGTSADVKTFAQKMIDDHGKLGDKMKTVAGDVGVTPPTSIPVADDALEAKLKLLSGDSFDKAYISAMVKDHKEDLEDFNKEIASGTSPEVKKAATEGKTVISQHYMMIRKIAAAHNVTAQAAQHSTSTNGL